MKTLVVILSTLCVTSVHAHQTTTGWAYDSACCSNQDCHPIPTEQVQVKMNGYLATDNGITKFFEYNEVKKSLDEHYHACSNKAVFRCLYVPQMSY